jgi:hypothetical protein
VPSFANNPSALNHIGANWRQQSSFDLPMTSQQNRGSFHEAMKSKKTKPAKFLC